uniref:J domain-containing protein n=1 Tax=Steinernema glaseri TaxID=37863 RepID=A0A1I7Y656_9BILA
MRRGASDHQSDDMDAPNLQKLGDSDLYGLLGCSKFATSEQIMAEYRARVRDCHPDKTSDNGSEATKEFQKLLYAKEVLTTPSKRYLYDMWLTMGVGISLEQWMANKEHVQQTMHWANKAPTPMLKSSETRSATDNARPEWSRAQSSVISAFRSYKI